MRTALTHLLVYELVTKLRYLDFTVMAAHRERLQIIFKRRIGMLLVLWKGFLLFSYYLIVAKNYQTPGNEPKVSEFISVMITKDKSARIIHHMIYQRFLCASCIFPSSPAASTYLSPFRITIVTARTIVILRINFVIRTINGGLTPACRAGAPRFHHTTC